MKALAGIFYGLVRRHKPAVVAFLYPVGYTCGMRVEKTAEYRDWIDGLKDQAGRARILMRVDRLIYGNPGSHRNLTEGVSELKIDVGPGYRVYYSLRGTRLLLLIAGGDKASQAKDIALALELNRNFVEKKE